MTDKNDEKPKPVECGNKKCKFFNDPYPESGKCIKCGVLLKGHPHRLTSETGSDANARGTTRRRNILARAKQYVEDAGLKWRKVDALTQDLAIRAATTKDRHDSTLLLQQLGKLKARPKTDEGAPDIEVSVFIDAEQLAKTLEILDEIS